ncbi:YdeI/OmpD-associated family protein [Ornithinimicrobium sp. F0845]|uniref:YdeI/OmpD-associated family protein n=1 Tax=Ornithinimicrobium sp. F0845 TaxID=2926412 RepID=UPI001FF5302C|nr:YdeI/OmpD-associated family protein [Ornithinimicrobium sp. F0845]MCK0114201.1 YdeI/OmpD-associated family protein [Ornithinimicrobium sp. F0845]
MLTLQTTLDSLGGPAAAIVLTDEQVAELGPTKNPPVVVTIDGKSARLRVARMGGLNCIGLSKAVRAALGVEIDQEVSATVELDTAERTVDMPPELTEALEADPAAKAAFEALSYSARKEHARQVSSAKAAETRDRRLAKILDSLRG